MFYLTSISRLNWLILGLLLIIINSFRTPSRQIYRPGTQTVQNIEGTNEYITPWEAELKNIAQYSFANGEKVGLNKGQ
ncbi:MAG: hypothetical protein M3Q56_10055 [Bacteroidota bacterium]|nr:hypothetical protein [Bacteroidota bacterium]